MLDPQIKKEMTEDAFSKSRQKAFEEADKRAQEFIQKHWATLDIDQAINFLMSVQDIAGPFPISKEIPAHLNNFRL